MDKPVKAFFDEKTGIHFLWVASCLIYSCKKNIPPGYSGWCTYAGAKDGDRYFLK